MNVLKDSSPIQQYHDHNTTITTPQLQYRNYNTAITTPQLQPLDYLLQLVSFLPSGCLYVTNSSSFSMPTTRNNKRPSGENENQVQKRQRSDVPIQKRPILNEMPTWQHCGYGKDDLKAVCENKGPWALTCVEAEEFLGLADEGPRRSSYRGTGSRPGATSTRSSGKPGWRQGAIEAFAIEDWTGMSRSGTSRSVSNDEERADWWELVQRMLDKLAEWEDLGWTAATVAEWSAVVEKDVASRGNKKPDVWVYPVGYYITCAVRAIFHDMAKRTSDFNKKLPKTGGPGPLGGEGGPEDEDESGDKNEAAVLAYRDINRPYTWGGVPVRVGWLDLDHSSDISRNPFASLTGDYAQPAVRPSRDFGAARWEWLRLYHGSIWGVAKMVYSHPSCVMDSTHRFPREVLGLMADIPINVGPDGECPLVVAYNPLAMLSLHSGVNVTNWVEHNAGQRMTLTVLVVQYRGGRQRQNSPPPRSVMYWRRTQPTNPIPVAQPAPHRYSTKELSFWDPTGGKKHYGNSADVDADDEGDIRSPPLGDSWAVSPMGTPSPLPPPPPLPPHPHFPPDYRGVRAPRPPPPPPPPRHQPPRAGGDLSTPTRPTLSPASKMELWRNSYGTSAQR